VGKKTTYGGKRTDQRGAAAVEFALVVPLLLMLVFGIVDFGYMVNRVSLVNNAARDAAREGSLAGTQASITATATAALDGVPGTTVTVSCTKPDGSACATYDADATSGGTTVVTINYEHEMITPIAFIFGDSVNLSRTARMRIE
jgi:Flp pilus assembly protein TadG